MVRAGPHRQPLRFGPDALDQATDDGETGLKGELYLIWAAGRNWLIAMWLLGRVSTPQMPVKRARHLA